MAQDSSGKYLPTIVALLIVSTLLMYVDYNDVIEKNSPSLLANIMDSWSQTGSIDAKLLSNTSLANQSIISLGKSQKFFPPYLDLPEKTKVQRYAIEGTSIEFSEMRQQDSELVIQFLLSQTSEAYSFHQINDKTFYLNQTPAADKTHNYLGIIINEILYGFQYKPIEHRKILEIIDELPVDR